MPCASTAYRLRLLQPFLSFLHRHLTPLPFTKWISLITPMESIKIAALRLRMVVVVVVSGAGAVRSAKPLTFSRATLVGTPPHHLGNSDSDATRLRWWLSHWLASDSRAAAYMAAPGGASCLADCRWVRISGAVSAIVWFLLSKSPYRCSTGVSLSLCVCLQVMCSAVDWFNAT